MKKAKVVYNKGFYIGNEIEYIEELPLYLVTKGIVRLAVDSGLAYYKKGEKEDTLNVGTINVTKEFRKKAAQITNMNELEGLNEFEKINIYDSIGMWIHEEEFFYENEGYISLFFYPITIIYKDFSVKVYPVAKFYHDGRIIISHNIYFNNKINFKTFGNIVSKIEIEPITTIELPTAYLYNIDYDKSKTYTRNENDENIEFICLENFKLINNFIDLSKFILLLFGAKNTSNIFYSRILYLIDDTKLSENSINKLLNCCMTETKKCDIGKDYRLFKDYSHYENDSSTVIVGKDCLQHYPSIQSREEYIILRIMRDSIIFKNAAENKYTYNQLKRLRLDYMLEENHYACSPYSEINDSIMHIYNSMHKDIRVKNLNILLEEKIKEKEISFQDNITLIALLFACQPLTEYILIPLYSLYCDFIGFTYNEDFIKVCMICIAILIVLIIYLLIRNKSIK